MGRVIIVGAGPGGATLAYLLARCGIEVALLERQEDFAREFRGEVLLPSGLEPFDQMGLWDQIEAVPHVRMQGARVYLDGRPRFSVDFEAEAFGRYFPRWMSQPALLEMLVSAAAAHPGFTLLRGASVGSLVFDRERCSGVRGRGPDGDFELSADLVVGADGRTSVVRRRAGLAAREDPTPMDVVWLKLPPLPALRDAPRFAACVGSGHLMIVAPVYDDTLQLGWIIPKGRFGEIRRRGLPECLDEMARHAWPELAEHIRRHRNDALRPFLLSTVSDHVHSWTRPGVLVLGDAAHTMSPVGAQGLNVAIRDAVVAANHLVPLLSGPSPASLAVDAAARSVERERRPGIERVQRLQAAPPRLLFRDAAWARAALALLTLLPGLFPRRVVARAAARLGAGVSDVRLRV